MLNRHDIDIIAAAQIGFDQVFPCQTWRHSGVERLDLVCQRADRDEIDAALGVVAYRVERDACLLYTSRSESFGAFVFLRDKLRLAFAVISVPLRRDWCRVLCAVCGGGRLSLG